MNRLLAPVVSSQQRFRVGLVAAVALIVLLAAAGCGDTGSSSGSAATTGASTTTQASADQAAKRAAAKRQAAHDQTRARKITRFFRTQKMTPSDLYVEGIDAPESMTKVYGIQTIRVNGSTVTITTDMYPKSDNKNEFAGACNQVISGYGASWAKHIEVIGQDDARHGQWDDTDGDGTDDSSGYMACQSDL
jgi:hypothetical protein